MFGKFTTKEKTQIIKWYFSGNAFTSVVNLCIRKYGFGCSTSTIQRTIQNFEKNGCVQFYCRKCIGFSHKPLKTDEDELDEIMVCAAAELELSIRYIAIELEMTVSKVYAILKKYSYYKSNNDDIPEECSEEKRQIVKWYCKNNSLPKMIKLFVDKFKCADGAKEHILNIISEFEMYGCIRNCQKCITRSDKSMHNFEINSIEELISRQSNELEMDIDSKQFQGKAKFKSVPSQHKKKKIKLEHHRELPSISLGKIRELENKDFDESECSSHVQDVEFIPVKPTVDMIVVNESFNKKRKKTQNPI